MKTANPSSATTSLAGGDVDMRRQRQRCQLDRYSAATVSIDSLRPVDSPRVAGESTEHTRTLAELDAPLPPIFVHRSTLRVIDGMHRLQAATLKGQAAIDVQFYDGDEADIFVLAVELNIAHGLPLSLPDRTAAATRIVGSHPHWSDRRIASVTGLSATTVGAIRTRTTASPGQSDTRVGRDGRTRPVSSAAGRELATELMRAKPDASLRDIAAAAGISPSTAQDVRTRLRNGNDPLPDKRRDQREQGKSDSIRPASPEQVKRRNPQRREWEPALQRLRWDPSLRFTDTGRALLRLLDSHLIGAEHLATLTRTITIPAHCTQTIAQLARLIGNRWHELAEQLDN